MHCPRLISVPTFALLGILLLAPWNVRSEAPDFARQILPILSGNRDGALLGINSNWLDISKFEFHYGEDLDWYLASRDQISSLLEKGELPNEKSKETVSSLIQRLLEKAINLNASDIHLEIQKDFLRVCFRIDGVLQKMGKLSTELTPQIFSR